MSKADADFSTTLSVNIDAINYGGHLAHDKLITMMHEARLRFFDQLAQSEIDFYGNGLILKSLYIDYQQQSFRRQQLTFYLQVSEFRGTGFTLLYDIHNQDQLSVATAEINLISYDYVRSKVIKLSPKFKQQLTMQSQLNC